MVVKDFKVMTLNPPFHPKFSRSSRSPAVSKGGCVYYPIWIGYTTGVLEQNNVPVKLFDAPAESRGLEESLHIIKDYNPDLIVMDSTTASIANDLHVANEIKKILPDAFIVFVGTHPTAVPFEVLKSSKNVDAVALSEHEHTIRDLSFALRDGKPVADVAGLVYRTTNSKGEEEFEISPKREPASGEELDKMPFVSEVYSRHLNIKNYFYPSVLYPEVTIITGRGCPFRCTFCVYPQTMGGHEYRVRSPENVVDEFEWIFENLDVKDIMIEDDTFTANRERINKICDLIVERGLQDKVTWTCNARADVDLDTLKNMKRAGCRLLCVGFESGEQEILNNVKKGTQLQIIRQFMKDTKKADVLVHGCFMLGNKGETKQTIRTTIEFAKELEPDTAQFFPIMVYPGTEAYDYFKKEGLIKAESYGDWLDKEGNHNTIISRPGLTDKELVELCDRGRWEFYMRPKYVLRKIWQGITHPKEFPRLLKSSKSFFKYLLLGSESVRTN